MSYIAIVFRKPHESLRSCTEVIPELTVRLLQDCPAEASNLRRVSGCAYLVFYTFLILMSDAGNTHRDETHPSR